MTKDGSREANTAFALTAAAMYGQVSHKVARVLALIPPSSLLSALTTSDSATKIKDLHNLIVFSTTFAQMF